MLNSNSIIPHAAFLAARILTENSLTLAKQNINNALVKQLVELEFVINLISISYNDRI